MVQFTAFLLSTVLLSTSIVAAAGSGARRAAHRHVAANLERRHGLESSDPAVLYAEALNIFGRRSDELLLDEREADPREERPVDYYPQLARRSAKRARVCASKASSSSFSSKLSVATSSAIAVTHAAKPTTARLVNPIATAPAEPEPQPKPTPTPKKSSSAAPPAQTHKSSNNGGGNSGNPMLTGTKSGQGTYYGTGLGSCGITNSDTDYIAAVSHILYDGFPGATANPNNNPICGRTATAHYQGKSVTVKIVDRCVGCQEWDLDFSPAAFSQIADQALGRIDITWAWD